jgi:hypothetical protein
MTRISGSTLSQMRSSSQGGPGGITLDAFGAPISEENDGEIVPGWWTG